MKNLKDQQYLAPAVRILSPTCDFFYKVKRKSFDRNFLQTVLIRAFPMRHIWRCFFCTLFFKCQTIIDFVVQVTILFLNLDLCCNFLRMRFNLSISFTFCLLLRNWNRKNSSMVKMFVQNFRINIWKFNFSHFIFL